MIQKTEKRTSIQEIMNRMAGHMDVLLDESGHTQQGPRPTLLDEVRLWVAVDPLLAELHKQYLDAQKNHARLKNRHGESDPICDVAADMEDSAKCAVDTRMIELRQSEEAKAAVQAIIRKAQDNRAAQLVAAEHAQSSQFWRNFAVRKAPLAVARGQGSYFKMMIGVLVLQHLIGNAQHHLRIAEAFCRAAGLKRLAASG